MYETTFKITVDQQNDKLFTFKRATAYFDGDNAKAYGTVPTTAVLAATADTKIGFDLYTLYKEGSISADKQNTITFTEEKPSRVVSGKKQFAPAWLDETLPQPTKNSKLKFSLMFLSQQLMKIGVVLILVVILLCLMHHSEILV